jgi:hypothetical protein
MLLQCPSLRLCLRSLLASENRLDVLHDLGLRLGHLGLGRVVTHLLKVSRNFTLEDHTRFI